MNQELEAPAVREPNTRWTTVALALFSAVSAIGGGVELLLWRAGNPYLPPRELLEHTPFQSFVVPGLLLALVVGGTSLAAGILTWLRSKAAIDVTILAGGALTIWIFAEAAMLREVHWLHVLYGVLGGAIAWLGVRAAWRSGQPRHRWVLGVTLAEATGFLAPACVGILVARAGLGDLERAGLLTAAGFVEGAVLGTGQAWVLPLPVNRLRYALLTGAGAAVVWASVMSTMWAGSAPLPAPVLVALGVATGLVGLAAIGTAQWIELRHHVHGGPRWIGWTALAWAVALPLSFTPAPFVDEATPIGAHVVLWGSAGLLMAYVMALVTWQGARRLTQETSRATSSLVPKPCLVSSTT